MDFIIPTHPPADKLEAARFYREKLGWTVHPLTSPTDKNLPPKIRGKKPIIEAWPKLALDAVTDEFIEQYWGNSLPNNIGVVVRPPHVVVDLDSKSDAGESVRRWLGQQEGLQKPPRIRTGGGCHLHFICKDLPGILINGKSSGKALTAKIDGNVTAELFFNGQNIVLAPSLHASGVAYTWEVTGKIPEVTWAQLQGWFGFVAPDKSISGNQHRRTGKAAAWWTRFEGSIPTLDVVKLAQALEIYGEPVGSDGGKHSVKCPWQAQHGNAGDVTDADSSAVVFEGGEGKWPGFKCLHASHGEKSFEDFLGWCDDQKPGVVDLHCARKRTWEVGSISEGGKPEIQLPTNGRPDSEFASDCGKIISPKNVWFRKGKFVVEIRQNRFNEHVSHLGFHQLRSIEVCSGIEDHITVGTVKEDGGGKQEFTALSMSERTAAMLINSPQLQRELPLITRVVGYRVPLIVEGKLTLSQPGFDPASGLYTDPNAPDLVDNMDRQTALMWLRELTEEFCFDGQQSISHFIARLLTPLCHGIMGWDQRGPFWIFTANRERLGKDYMAGIPGLLFDGHTNEDAPLEPHNSTETRKRITSALMAGRGRMHFANCSGHIHDSALEQAITSNVWSDRVLGSNTDLSLPNEIEFSMSGNMGVVTYRGDLANRARHIRLTFAQENPNQRQFKNPQLHRWVFGHRADILSALVALIKHWVMEGQPLGTTPFASFPRWAAIVGGILRANGLGDPCQPEEVTTVGGNEEERDMKLLFSLGHEKFGVVAVELKKILTLLKDDDGGSQLFGWIDLEARSGETAFGKLIRRYGGRIFGGIVLKVHDNQKRPRFAFQKFDSAQKPEINPVDTLFGPVKHGLSGDIGDFGDVLYPPCGDSVIINEKKIIPSVDILCGHSVENVPNLPIVPTYTVITDRAYLSEIAQAIATSGSAIALDIETYGENALNPFHGDIRLLSLDIGRPSPWLLDLKALGYDLGPLKPVLESSLIVGQNIKFDLRWLSYKCGLRAKNVFCTMTASRLLSAGPTKRKHDLTAVVDRYLEITLPKDCSRSNWGANELNPEQLQYAASDVIHLLRLKTVLDQELVDAGLVETAALEMALIPVVTAMENTGFPIDTAKLRQLGEACKDQANAARVTVLSEFQNPELNPNSVPQVKAAFSKLGVELDKTDAEALANIDHPAAKALLSYRQSTKQFKLIETLNEAIETDGRIHSSFKSTGTETGRFSSSKPNLQNVSRGEVRTCFIAPPGYKLVVADYSQIELRAVAAIAGESKMLEAYRRGEDLHKKTASIILDKSPEAVTSEDRQLAKPVNFGLLYGQGAQGLVNSAKSNYGVTFSLDQAETFRGRFFAEYEKLDKWHRDARQTAGGDAFETRTRLGRRRLLHARSKWWKRFAQLVNAPVQGGCADGLKLALVELAGSLPSTARIISTVHDEIIVEAPETEADTVNELVREVMIRKMAGLFPEVPIEVESNVCMTWGEK